jgi:hypothetical protein
VFTDDVALEHLLADAGGAVVRADGSVPHPSDRTVLWLADLATAEPAVPDAAGITDAVVVVTAGTRTDFELAEMAQTTVDAGYRLAGVVVVRRTRPAEPSTTDPSQVDAHRPSITDDAMAGMS